MSAFEFLFSFYGLLLGLTLAEIAVGVCAPVVAVIVLLGAMNLWLSFRGAREAATGTGGE